MNKCKFCENTFRTESTMAKHMCVKKRRYLDKDTIGSQLGFRVFQRFFELTTVNKKPKTFDEFIHSPYYMAFVKFGRHLVDLNPIDSNEFVDYVIKNGVKLSDWGKDAVYAEYLKAFMEKELVDRALERSILEIDNWAKNNNKKLQDFFTDVNVIEAVFLLKSGRISPWVLYLSDSSGNLLENMTSEQLAIIQGVIDPKKWESVFMSHEKDVIFVKSVLREAGL